MLSVGHCLYTISVQCEVLSCSTAYVLLPPTNGAYCVFQKNKLIVINIFSVLLFEHGYIILYLIYNIL